MAGISDIYGIDDEDEPTRQVQRPTLSQGRTWVEIDHNGTKLMLPNMDYVALLERRLMDAEHTIRRLDGEVQRLTNASRRRQQDMYEVQRRLDGKVDRE